MFESSWLPSVVAGQEEAFRALRLRFDGVLDGVGHATAAIHGPVGSGKTVVARRFALDAVAECRRQGRPAVTAYVDCVQSRSLCQVLLEAAGQLGLGLPGRGYGAREVLGDVQRFLKTKDMHLVLVLDEVGGTMEAGRECVGRFLGRLNPEAGSWWGISTILVDPVDPSGFLSQAGRSLYGYASGIQTSKYSEGALLEILEGRARLGLRGRSWTRGQLEGVAGAAAGLGDARLAIEVLRLAASSARLDGRWRISNRDFREALVRAGGVDSDRVGRLTVGQRRVLEAVRGVAVGREATTGEVVACHRSQSEASGLRPLSGTQLWKHLRTLHRLRLVRCRLSGKGQAGTTQLIQAVLPGGFGATGA